MTNLFLMDELEVSNEENQISRFIVFFVMFSLLDVQCAGKKAK